MDPPSRALDGGQRDADTPPPERAAVPHQLSGDLPLGLRTHLLVGPGGMSARPLGDALVVRTADMNSFYFGNFLFLPRAPRAADLSGRLEQWRTAFADAPGVEKVVLQWESGFEDSGIGNELADAARRRGLEPDIDVVLRLEQAAPREPRTPMRARFVESEADWATALEVATEPTDSASRRTFHAWRRREHRRLVEAGHGLWWIAAAEADGRPVSSAGIFWNDSGTLARFQSVDTRFDARGQGFATGLLSAMLVDIQRRLPRLETCVIVATLDSQAERIYRSLGFEALDRLESLWGDRHAAAGEASSAG